VLRENRTGEMAGQQPVPVVTISIERNQVITEKTLLLLNVEKTVVPEQPANLMA